MFVTVQYRTDSGQCGLDRFMGPEELEPRQWHIVYAADWQDSERYLEEIFAFLNHQGPELLASDTTIERYFEACRSMSVGDRVIDKLGIWTCAARGWEFDPDWSAECQGSFG